MRTLQKLPRFFVCAMAGLLCACTSAPSLQSPSQSSASKDAAIISGTAMYRERMALPPDAVFEATLEDVSRADAPSLVLGTTRIDGPSAPPIHFSIQYKAQRIEPAHRYVVRARILHRGQLMFTTDTAHPVLTHGAGSSVEVQLRRSTSNASESTSTATLENTYWKVLSIRGKTVSVRDNQREPHMLLHPADARVSGHGGCNGFMGGYELREDRISFKQMASTMMACLDGMEHEQALHEALRHVARYRIEGERLQLLDADGAPLVELESRYLR